MICATLLAMEGIWYSSGRPQSWTQIGIWWIVTELRVVFGRQISKNKRALAIDHGPWSHKKRRSSRLLQWNTQVFPSLPTTVILSLSCHALLTYLCIVLTTNLLRSKRVLIRQCCQKSLLCSSSSVSKGMMGLLRARGRACGAGKIPKVLLLLSSSSLDMLESLLSVQLHSRNCGDTHLACNLFLFFLVLL